MAPPTSGVCGPCRLRHRVYTCCYMASRAGVCSIEGCGYASRITRGLCPAHYSRLRRYGSPEGRPAERVIPLCSITGCTGPHYGHGLCKPHWSKQYAESETVHPDDQWMLDLIPGFMGRAYPPDRYVRPSMMEVFWSKFRVDADTGCWLWTGSLFKSGYGVVTYQPLFRSARAHRALYLVLVGDIADNNELDHLCHTRSDCLGGASCPHKRCVNPAHMEEVLHSENMARTRGRTPPGTQARVDDRTHCIHGHEFTPENTYTRPDGLPGRDCRVCIRERSLRRSARGPE